MIYGIKEKLAGDNYIEKEDAMTSVMYQYTEISDYISELLSKGYSSLARETGQGNLEAFKTLDKGLAFLKDNTFIHSDDVLKSVTLLKLLVDLREKIIRTREIFDSRIPDIHKPVDSLNCLLIKSADYSIKKNDTESITKQCEDFLNIADEIRKDKRLRGLGILNRKLKKTIGRLREKAGIESVFKDEHLDAYNAIIFKADETLEEGDLQKIGKKIQEIRKKIDGLGNKFIHRNRLFAYFRRYENNYVKKIKSKMNVLSNKSMNISYYDCQEIIDQFLKIENLFIYHENKGLSFSIRRQKKKIKQVRIDSISKNLMEMKNFVLNAYQKPFWKDYEHLYRKEHKESEIFSDIFYEYTLKGLIPTDVSKLLQGKIKKLKTLNLKEIKFIPHEQILESRLVHLIQVFENCSGKIQVKKSQL